VSVEEDNAIRSLLGDALIRRCAEFVTSFVLVEERDRVIEPAMLGVPGRGRADPR
jgi:hypothetical protein